MCVLSGVSISNIVYSRSVILYMHMYDYCNHCVQYHTAIVILVIEYKVLTVCLLCIKPVSCYPLTMIIQKKYQLVDLSCKKYDIILGEAMLLGILQFINNITSGISIMPNDNISLHMNNSNTSLLTF